MKTRQKVAQIPIDDQSVTPERLIEGIPPLRQGVDLLCGYFCIRMIRAAASVDEDGVLEDRCRSKRWCEEGLALRDVAEELRRVPGWEEVHESRGPVETVWTEVAQAARNGRPSVLWLPRSRQYEHGHYVIVTGVGEYDDGHESEQVLRVQDPMHGHRWSPWREWTAWRLKLSGEGSQVRAFIAPEDWRP